MKRSLKKLLRDWQKNVNPSDPQPPSYTGKDRYITRFHDNSRTVQRGDLFVARRRRQGDGTIFSDGHPYIPQAIQNGARVILAEDPTPNDLPKTVTWLHVSDTSLTLAYLAAAWHNFPSKQLTVIGVTGTDGKTSICNILFAVLKHASLQVGLISTINAVIGTDAEPTGLHVTTPESPAIQQYLRRMVDAGTTHCILETTSHGLAQNRVAAVNFDIGILSNITHEHLDYHGSYDAYLAAKGRLFEMASRHVVLNKDDGSYDSLAQLTQANLISYAIDQPADISASNIQFSASATKFTVTVDNDKRRPLSLSKGKPLSVTGDLISSFENEGSTSSPSVDGDFDNDKRRPLSLSKGKPLSETNITSTLVGKFNIANMLATTGCALALGLDMDTIKHGLQSIDAISGRMERIDAGQAPLVIVDFAHTPNSLSRAIEAAQGMCHGKVITVFGSAGKRDVAKRRIMAEVSAVSADFTILTAEDPRTDSLNDILAVMADGCRNKNGVENQTFWRIPDRGRAIHHALTLATKNDIILICGKGHEQSMAFGTTEFPWDDRDAARRVIGVYLGNLPIPNLGLPTF